MLSPNEKRSSGSGSGSLDTISFATCALTTIRSSAGALLAFQMRPLMGLIWMPLDSADRSIIYTPTNTHANTNTTQTQPQIQIRI